MKDAAFRIVMATLVDDFEKELNRNKPEDKKEPKSKDDILKAIYKGLELIQEKKIKDLATFNTYLSTAGIDKKEFADAVKQIINEKKPERVIQLAMFLGEGVNDSGLNLLKRSWWERNFPDEVLRKVLAPQWWKLFRSPEWLEKNKVTKD